MKRVVLNVGADGFVGVDCKDVIVKIYDVFCMCMKMMRIGEMICKYVDHQEDQ